MPTPKLGILKEFDPKDKNPCQGCSYCCEYVALEIDKPNTEKDFNFILWYVIHKDVWVYVDEEAEWYIQFNTPCDKLQDDRRCGYYPERPQICRDYEAVSCSRYGGDPEEKYMFKNEKDLYDYLAIKRPAIYKKMKKKLKPSYKPKKQILEYAGPERD